MPAVETVDLKKVFKSLYAPSAKAPAFVTVPPLQVLVVEGEGDPNSAPAFQDAIQALYSVAYTLKFTLKARPELPGYVVMPLEALWWTPGEELLSEEHKAAWSWRAFIVQPDFILPEHVAQARSDAARKKSLASLERLRFEPFEEGLCAQIMHLGPWDAERPTIERLHAFIREAGYQRRGLHHEIYLSDPGRTAPEKLKTVVRQPVVKV